MKPLEYSLYLQPLKASESDASTGFAVVHLVGRVTDDVYSFLGPLVQTLKARGVRQLVIARTSAETAHNLAQLELEADVVRLPEQRWPWQRARSMYSALVQQVSAPSTVYCHLHGVVPSLIGALAARMRGFQARLLFSPHGSRLLGRMRPLAQVLVRLVQCLTSREMLVPIANSGEDAKRVSSLAATPVRLIESPVHPAFFAAPRKEAARPLVLAGVGVSDAAAARRFSQLAVLYWARETPVEYVWLGAADAESRARLRAVGVRVLAGATAAERAQLMSQAWAFIALGDAEGYASVLAEAMASGLPCIGWDRQHHRDLITNGVTGQLANDESQCLSALAALLGSPADRKRLGTTARAMAMVRFDRERFDRAVLAAYNSVPTRLAA